MSAISLATAQAHLEKWVEADAAVASNQSYAIAGRSLTRADAAEITAKIQFWEAKVNRLQRASSGRSRISYGVPR